MHPASTTHRQLTDAQLKAAADAIRAAINALKLDVKKINGTLFKYGYDNSTGTPRYTDGGFLMNDISVSRMKTAILANPDLVRQITDLIGYDDPNTNWARFSEEGKIADGSSILRADDHYNRWRADIVLMAEMGIQIYRFGIEWSRIEPERGAVSRDAIEHYRDEISYMKEKGILPLLTIHHFTHPRWFEDMGGFTCKESVDIFMSYVKVVVDSFGDLVSEYITINEPNVYCTNSLFYGTWPPEKKSLGALVAAFSNMTACHVKAYEYIHRRRTEMGYTDTMVSFANHLRVFEPKNPKNPWHRLCASLTDWLFQGAITKAMMTGVCRFPVMRRKGVKRGKYYDFIGINYYSRSTVSGIADGVREGCYKNDLGWDLYPEGLISL